MTNHGVPNVTANMKNAQITFEMETQIWKCNICGKTEKPQDYANLERHIWRRNGKRKKNLQTEEANN